MVRSVRDRQFAVSRYVTVALLYLFVGRIQEFASGGRPLSLEVVSPLNQLGGLGERYKSNRKRIWCTLKLRESHWWQSF